MNRRPIVVLCLFVLFIFLPSLPANACTTFVIDNGQDLIFGRNYDWMLGDGLVVINKRGVEKNIGARVADVDGAIKFVEYGENHRLSWRSKYASLTFNQYGCEIPTGGINEAGLVVELMWLAKTRYPKPDRSRYEVSEMQWIQYQLDNCSTVEQVIASDAKIRIKPDSVPIHFLVCDKSGKTAAIEFLKAKMVCHTGEKLPIKALTNDTYSKSYQFLTSIEGFGGTGPIPTGPKSLERFARASSLVEKYDKKTSKSTVQYGFYVLENVAQQPIESKLSAFTTQWSIIYDVRSLRVYFRTRAAPQIRYVDLSSFDLGCKTPRKVLDVNAGLRGNVASHFKDYTWQANRDLIYSTFSKTPFLSKWPKDILDVISHVPDSTTCYGR